MPVVDLRVMKRDLAAARVPVESAVLTVRAVRADGPFTLVDGRDVVFSFAMSAALSDGELTDEINLSATDGTFGYEWEIIAEAQLLFHRVTDAADVDRIDFGDLNDLDRSTLQPTDENIAAWYTVTALAEGILGQTATARDETVAAAGTVGSAVSAAQGAAGAAAGAAGDAASAASSAASAAGTASSAATAAGTARDAAVTARGAAETARDQAQAVAASKGQANGIAPLGPDAKLPEAQVPDRLSAPALSSTIGAVASKVAVTPVQLAPYEKTPATSQGTSVFTVSTTTGCLRPTERNAAGFHLTNPAGSGGTIKVGLGAIDTLNDPDAIGGTYTDLAPGTTYNWYGPEPIWAKVTAGTVDVIIDQEVYI